MNKISVVMAVYNEPLEWMKLSIESILNQSYRDYELIIVNDNPCRLESSVYLTEISNRDNRIRVINNEINIGLTKSLNKGLSIATGKYIARMDADDIALSMRFEKQVAYLDEHDDVMVLGASVREIDERGNLGKNRNKSDSYEYLRTMILLESPVVHPVSMFRRIINGEPIMYDESFRYAQDYALWASLIRDYKIVNLKDILLLYRVSSSQISQKNITIQNECARRTFERILTDYSMNADEDTRNTIISIIRERSNVLDNNDTISNVIQFIKSNMNNSYCNMIALSNCLSILMVDYLKQHYGKIESIKASLKLLKGINHLSVKTKIVLTKICLFS